MDQRAARPTLRGTVTQSARPISDEERNRRLRSLRHRLDGIVRRLGEEQRLQATREGESATE